jgi:hypothetical protein
MDSDIVPSHHAKSYIASIGVMRIGFKLVRFKRKALPNIDDEPCMHIEAFMFDIYIYIYI